MTWIEVVGWLVIGVAIVLSLTAYLLSMCLMAYCSWVGFRVMVRVDLTPKAVRAMRVGELRVPILTDEQLDELAARDIAAIVEAGDKSRMFGRQKVGEA